MALNGRQLFLILPWFAVGLVVAALWWWQTRAPQPALTASCPDLQAGCAVQIDNRIVTLRVEGKLQVLKPFELKVVAPGARKVQVQFTMAGMDMGFNLYTLRPDGQGAFQARIVLPVCVSGRRDWVMSLEINGRRLDIPFVTELS